MKIHIKKPKNYGKKQPIDTTKENNNINKESEKRIIINKSPKTIINIEKEDEEDLELINLIVEPKKKGSNSANRNFSNIEIKNNLNSENFIQLNKINFDSVKNSPEFGSINNLKVRNFDRVNSLDKKKIQIQNTINNTKKNFKFEYPKNKKEIMTHLSSLNMLNNKNSNNIIIAKNKKNNKNSISKVLKNLIMKDDICNIKDNNFCLNKINVNPIFNLSNIKKLSISKCYDYKKINSINFRHKSSECFNKLHNNKKKFNSIEKCSAFIDKSVENKNNEKIILPKLIQYKTIEKEGINSRNRHSVNGEGQLTFKFSSQDTENKLELNENI